MHPQFLVWCLTFGAQFKNDGHYFCGAGGNRPDGSDEALTHNPYSGAARLHGDLAGCFKIKLSASGYRLIYKVIGEEIVIWVRGVL
ncbi:type II toxin-antitoxin system RelE/ParE family toxin [Escherichia coli]|nr:type II toxin-antitoxin system RelE/ParE family toxin [Escherichia coli]